MSSVQKLGDEQSAQSLRNAHTVWSFVEAVYLTDGSVHKDHLSVRLKDWYHKSFSEVFVQAERILEDFDNESPVEEEKYWNTVARLAASGARHLAEELIVARKSSHGTPPTEEWASTAGPAALGLNEELSDDNDPLLVAEKLLRECPSSVIGSHRDNSWGRWQESCDQWARSEELEDHTNIYGSIESACAEATANFDTPKIADGALVEAALGCPARAIIDLFASMDTPWFAAHLCDLLVRAQVFPPSGPPEWSRLHGMRGMREHYLGEFAKSLEQYRGTWRMAASYYEECGPAGAAPLKAMLERMPFESTSDTKAEKVIRYVERRKWTGVARLLCERIGSECMDTGNYGSALSWYARGSLHDKAEEVAKEALCTAEEFGPCKEGALLLECVVKALLGTSDQKLAESLEYVRLYAEFQSAVKNWKNSEEGRDRAIYALLALMECGGLERKHWLVVLMDIRDLICSQFPPLDLDTAQKLITYLELVSGKFVSTEMTTGIRRRIQLEHNLLGNEANEMLEKHVRLTRETLVEAVARAALV